MSLKNHHANGDYVSVTAIAMAGHSELQESALDYMDIGFVLPIFSVRETLLSKARRAWLHKTENVYPLSILSPNYSFIKIKHCGLSMTSTR